VEEEILRTGVLFGRCFCTWESAS